MTPSDFFIFLRVKSLIDGQNFNEDNKMKEDILILNVIHMVTIADAIFL